MLSIIINFEQNNIFIIKMMRDNRKINIETDFFDDQQCMYLDGQQPTAPDFLLRKDQAAITLYNALDTIRLQRLINGFNSISFLFKLRIKFSRQNFNTNKFQHKKSRTNQYGIQKSNFIHDSSAQQNIQLKSGRSEHKKKSQSLDNKYSNNNNYFREERRKILNSIAKTLSQNQEQRSLSNSKNKVKQSNSKSKNSPNKPSKEVKATPIKKEENLQINHRIERLQRLMNNIRREKQTKQPTIVHQKKIISTMPKKDKSKQHLRIFVQELQSIRKQVVEIKKLNKQILHHSQSRASHSSPSSRIRREQDSHFIRHRQLLRSQVLQNIHRSQFVHQKNSTENKSQRMSKVKQLYNSSKKSDIEQISGNQKYHPKQKRNQQQIAKDRSRGGSRQRQRDTNLYNNIYQHRSLVESEFKNAGQKEKNQKIQNQRHNTWQHISQLQKPSSNPFSESKQIQNIQIVQQKQEYPQHSKIIEQKRVLASNPMLGSPKILSMPQQLVQKIQKQQKIYEMSNNNKSMQANTIKKVSGLAEQMKKSSPELVPKIDLKALTEQKAQSNRIPPTAQVKNEQKQKYDEYEPINHPNTNNSYKYSSSIPNSVTQYTNPSSDPVNVYSNMRVYENYHQVDDYKHRMGEIKQTISLSHNSKFNSLVNSPNSSAFSYREQQHSHRDHPYSYREYKNQKPISIEPPRKYEPEPININYNTTRNQQATKYQPNKTDYNLYYNKYPQMQAQSSTHNTATNDASTLSYGIKSSNKTHSNPELIEFNPINISTHVTNMNNDNYGLTKYQFSSQQIPKNNQTNTNNRSHTGPSDYTDPAILRMFNLGPYKKNEPQDPSNRFVKFKQTVQSVLDDELSDNNTVSLNIKSNHDTKPLPSNYTFSDNFTYTYSKGSSMPTSIAKLQQQYMSVINGDGDVIYDTNANKMTPMKKKPSLEQMMSEYNKRSGEKGSDTEQLEYEQKYGIRYEGYR